MQNFLFVDLSSLTPGKPFAGFAAGSFVDMNGREVEFKASSLKTFMTNTLKAIALAKGKGMPGLPIDARAHDKGDAAGWVVDAAEGEVMDSEGEAVPVIMLAAEWTKLGLELLRDRIMANFSPTVDLKGKVIRGGSLTNWPASVDGNGVPLFPAVELAEGMYTVEFQERSLDDAVRRVRSAWEKEYGGYETPPYPGLWVLEVFEAYVIVGAGDKQFRVSYSAEDEDDGRIEFAPRDEWIAVEQAWVEAAIGRKLTDAELGRRTATGAVDTETTGRGNGAGRESNGLNGKSDVGEVIDMNLTKEELGALIGEQVKTSLAAELQQIARPPAKGGEGDGQPPMNVLGFLEMAEVGDEIKEALKRQLMEQHDLMRKQAALETAELIGRIRRESEIAEFAQAVTGGTPEVPYGLPVSAGDLKEFLGRLQPTDLEFARKLLGDIQTHGRQKFAELGHGKSTRPVVALQAEYAVLLKAHVAQGGAVEEWFDYAGIGDAAGYDLSQFVEKEK